MYKYPMTVEEGRAMLASLMSELYTLDMRDISAVVSWLYLFFFARDLVGVVEDAPYSEVMTHLTTAGFVKNMNTGKAYDGNNLDNSGRYIVGQFINVASAGRDGNWHGFHDIAELWLKRWSILPPFEPMKE